MLQNYLNISTLSLARNTLLRRIKGNAFDTGLSRLGVSEIIHDKILLLFSNRKVYHPSHTNMILSEFTKMKGC